MTPTRNSLKREFSEKRSSRKKSTAKINVTQNNRKRLGFYTDKK